MTVSAHQKIKKKIIQEISFLEKEIKELEEMTKPIPPECALGDLARFELMNDQLISEKTLHQARIRFNKLEYALRKVDEERYGLCIECEEEIPYERLLILPESSHCIECSSRLN